MKRTRHAPSAEATGLHAEAPVMSGSSTIDVNDTPGFDSEGDILSQKGGWDSRNWTE